METAKVRAGITAGVILGIECDHVDPSNHRYILVLLCGRIFSQLWSAQEDTTLQPGQLRVQKRVGMKLPQRRQSELTMKWRRTGRPTTTRWPWLGQGDTPNSPLQLICSHFLFYSVKKCEDPVRYLKMRMWKRSETAFLVWLNSLFSKCVPVPHWGHRGIARGSCMIREGKMWSWTKFESDTCGNNTKLLSR